LSHTPTDTLREAELAVLGAVFATNGKCIDDFTLTGEDFSEPRHGDLYDLMVKTHRQGVPVDQLTMSEANPGEAAFLWSLTDHVPAVSSAPFYAQIVQKHGMRRRLSRVGAAIAGLGTDLSIDDMVEAARGIVDNAVGGFGGAKVKFVRDILPDVIERLTQKASFVPSPWKTLNAAIGGFRPGAVYVVAARPGVGKTVVAAQIAANLAEHGNVAFASLEMTSEELVSRLISERLQIGVGKIKDSRMTDLDWQVFQEGRARLEALNIAIDDRSGVSVGDVRGFVRSVARTGTLSGVVVDYMQLMVAKQKMDRHLQVADFSRQLKIMAKEMQVPVVALSQLNRNSEATSLAVPKLSDLRESGAIEQDADVVMLLRREGEFPNERLIIDVAKNRHGETGEVDLAWEGMFSRAVEWGSTGRTA
jgi:replicative DNA helicase